MIYLTRNGPSLWTLYLRKHGEEIPVGDYRSEDAARRELRRMEGE